MTRRTHSLNAYESDVPSGAGATGDITVTSAIGLTAEVDDGMYLVISPEDVDNREYIKVTSVDVGSGLLGCAADRGLGGSVGGIAHTHPANAKVRAVSVHQWLNDIFDDIGDIDIILGNHIPGVDPHPQYLEEDEGNLLYLSRDGTTPPTADMPWNAKKITGIADGTLDADAVSKLQMETADGVVAGDAATALTTHIDDPADPHSAAGYLVSTDVVNVYLPLAGGSMLDSIDMQANKILDVGLPTLDGDAANKLYVDDAIGAIPPGFSGSHDDLSGISTNDHHDKYTDANAVAALAAADDYVKLGGDTMSGLLIVDTNIKIDYATGQAQFVNQVSGVGIVIGTATVAPNQDGTVDLGAAALKWDDLHVNTINGGPATFANVEAVLSELVTWANGQAAGITALA